MRASGTTRSGQAGRGFGRREAAGQRAQASPRTLFAVCACAASGGARPALSPHPALTPGDTHTHAPSGASLHALPAWRSQRSRRACVTRRVRVSVFFSHGGPRSTAAARPWCRDCLRAPAAPSAPRLSPPTSTLGHPPLCEPPLPASCNVRCETRRPPPPKRTKTRRCRYRDGCGASCRLPRWHLPTTRTPGHGLCCPLPVECRHRGAWGEGRPWAPLFFGCARVVFFWRFF